MNEFLILFKHELKTQFPFASQKRKGDVVGTILSLLITLLILTTFFGLVYTIADTYVTVKVDKVSAPIERASELLNVCYFVIIFATSFACVEKMRSTFSQQKDKHLFLRLPIKQQTLFMSKLCTLMIWNYALNFCLIVPVNVIFALAVDVGATFWLFTMVVWLTMPLVAFLIATLFVIPYIKFMEFISNKYWLIFILLSVLLIVAFVLYSLLLGLVQSLLETGSIKHLFNEAFVTTLQTMLNVYPINAFANIIFGQNLFVSLTLAVALAGLSVLVVYTISKHLYYATLYKNEIVSQPFQKSRNYNQLNPLISLIKKEFVTVFRNPNQLFSYFAIATAMPFMVYSCYTLFESLIENALGLSLTFPLALLILLVFSILTNTFCATNVSRDGLTALKSKVFPVKAKTLLLAKVLFCAIVSSLSVLASTILLGFATSLSWTDALIATFVGLVFSTAQIFVATKMDLKHCNVSATPAEMEAVSNRTITKVVFVGLILALLIGLSAVIINILSNSSFQLFILQPIFAYVIPLVGSVVYLTVAVVYYTFKIEKRFATLVM
ncbi:MAG: hypothetical protein IJF72_03670 [Clostridia bacterium]|nr:hypothetical protein [Clostridia bacterium]